MKRLHPKQLHQSRRPEHDGAPRMPNAHRGGFTLIELIVASIIATIVATAATFSLERLVESRDRSSARQAAKQNVYTVATTIANDVRNLVRDPYLLNTMVRITGASGTSSDKGDQSDELLMFCRDDRPIRPDGNTDPTYKEGGTYEVQYRLKPDSKVGGVVWQRRDPEPDDNYQGGGVAIPLAMNITSLRIQAFDGTAWRDSWDSDNDGYPHEIRITCKGEDPKSHQIVYAMASVAIDRVPNLFDPTHDEDYDPSSDIQNLDFGTGNGSSSGLNFGGSSGNSSTGSSRGGRRVIRGGGGSGIGRGGSPGGGGFNFGGGNRGGGGDTGGRRGNRGGSSTGGGK